MADELPRRRPLHILVTLTIDAAPLRAADEFTLTAVSATAGYSVDEPAIVGQQPRHGGQSLTVLLRVYPSPPPLRPPPLPRIAPKTNAPEYAPVDDPLRPPVNILITLTIDPAPTPPDGGIKATATSATAGYSVDEPSVRGSYALRGGRSVTLCVWIHPSPPPPPPPVVPWWIIQPDPSAFGRAVRAARTCAGVSQAELSRRTGVSEMTIRNLEHGTSPTAKTRDAVLAALAAAGQPLDPNPKKDEPTE